MGRNTHSVSEACREGITTWVGTLTLSVGMLGRDNHTGRHTHSVSRACREGITTRVGTLTLSVGHVGKG